MGKTGPVLISACLMGLKTRFDGCDSYDEEAVRAAGPCPVPVCPEQLGGLPTPREPALIEGGSGRDVLCGKAAVMDINGTDVTGAYVRGAVAVAHVARMTGARKAVLKENSPSCGVKTIYRGALLCRGEGVTAARLREMGIETIGF
jgi:uncharacterized protein YbbK (DUF523 family)